MSAIDDLATELARLPGIGRKTAMRLTYHLLKQSPEQCRRLADALLTIGEWVKPCARCFNLTEDELCSICRDPRRDVAVICVVEEASDIGAVERAAEFRGTYHVLGGRLSPLDGVGPEDLSIGSLLERVSGVDGWHLYWSARADFLRQLGNEEDAAEAYRRALSCEMNDSDRRFLEGRLARLTTA